MPSHDVSMQTVWSEFALTPKFAAERRRPSCIFPMARKTYSNTIVKCGLSPRSSPCLPLLLKSRSIDNRRLKVELIELPEVCDDPMFVKSLNERPGNLALAFDRKSNPVTQEVSLEPLPFVVPGDRFNEEYGWDSVRLPSTYKRDRTKLLLSSTSSASAF